jgi:hypothetical protein
VVSGVAKLSGPNVLAVEAVISELVSAASFPCFAGKYREIRRIQLEDDKLTAAFVKEIQSLTSRIP